MLKLKTMKLPRLTVLGRSFVLLACELLANAICWAIAAILFGRNKDTRPNLGLALLAWTLGLRHALDADHISAIDNATRCLININQYSVTCGLFFSLGHSSIVILVTVAIAISSDVYHRINGVGEVGGIIGAAVSGSFMFIIGLANSVILYRLLKSRRQAKLRERRRLNGEDVEDVERRPEENHMLMMRLLGPIINFVNRPWKMYPVGVLFGFGFDTASSIALLAVTALARKNSDGSTISSGDVVILPFLFTAGMTLIDSVDSVLMLHSYTQVPIWPIKLLTWDSEAPQPNTKMDDAQISNDPEPDLKTPDITEKESPIPTAGDLEKASVAGNSPAEGDRKVSDQKLVVMSGLSIILTLLSILVAFSISLIVIMGLIGEQCASCSAAAEAEDGGGLAGRWWRAWASANDQSGYIGIGIVGAFVLIVGSWYGGRWAIRRFKKGKMEL